MASKLVLLILIIDYISGATITIEGYMSSNTLYNIINFQYSRKPSYIRFNGELGKS